MTVISQIADKCPMATLVNKRRPESAAEADLERKETCPWESWATRSHRDWGCYPKSQIQMSIIGHHCQMLGRRRWCSSWMTTIYPVRQEERSIVVVRTRVSVVARRGLHWARIETAAQDTKLAFIMKWALWVINSRLRLANGTRSTRTSKPSKLASYHLLEAGTKLKTEIWRTYWSTRTRPSLRKFSKNGTCTPSKHFEREWQRKRLKKRCK